MPASLVPFALLALSVVLIVLGACVPIVARSNTLKVLLIGGGILGLAGPPACLALIRAALWIAAISGFSSCQFAYSRYLESIPDIAQAVTLIPFDFRFAESWYWLEKASDAGHLEAMYARGVRLKYDMFVPEAANRSLSGQELIDKAIGIGYRPDVPEEKYYFCRFRRH